MTLEHWGGAAASLRLWLSSPLRKYASRPPRSTLKEFVVRRMLPTVLPHGSAGLVLSVPGGGRVKLDYGEEIARLLLLHGAYEAAELASVQQLATAGTTAIDVGANVGIYTVAMAGAVGRTGCVLSFEPVPETARKLRANVQVNTLSQVVVIEAAAASASGRAEVQLANDSAYASLAQVKKGRATGQTVSVPVVTLDAVWDEHGRPRVSMCKIDVEGAELSVLEGAVRMLDTCHPALLLEADEGPQMDALVRWVVPRGYRKQTVDGFMPWNHLFVADPDPAR